MIAIILAAGRGKRMGSLTKNLPKPLLKICGKPIIDHAVNALPDKISKLIVVVGYRHQQLVDHLKNSVGERELIFIHQSNLGGTGMALLLAKDLLDVDERFCVMYGDEFVSKTELESCLVYKNAWLCHEITTELTETGKVKVNDNNRIIKIAERPICYFSNIAAGGLMIINSEIFRYVPKKFPDGEFYMTTMMQRYIQEYCVYAVMGKPDLYISNASDILRVEKMLEVKQ
jgi:UDP-N-acetylglucosamine diphosphorylase / glucose-1-phosphate thymidylyltransferase / UDP-N-acetylgalactosamine diphosphorylase / glucosamine-1-phosphate N-acetyltransferase / galactosamine-1-phosphate N-acetyltransferase